MIHQNSDSVQQRIAKAKAAEAAGELDDAAAIYEELVRQDNLNEYAYDRLMIIYRKKQLYKDELRTIKGGINAFENFYHSKLKGKSKKITEISNALLKSTGLSDKKGNTLYDPEPIGKWKKRKAVVEKKIK